MEDLAEWIQSNSEPGNVWFAKRLSGNDTLANASNQAGPYVPKRVSFSVFPALNNPKQRNPDLFLSFQIDSHQTGGTIRLVWYNSKLFPKKATSKGNKVSRGRDETRLTGWGGKSSPVLDPESTGSIAIFVFRTLRDGAKSLRVWVCNDLSEEELIESHLGAIEPGRFQLWIPDSQHPGFASSAIESTSPCSLTAAEIPEAWTKTFPTGAELVLKSIEKRKLRGKSSDVRLLSRRECEYQIFLSVEAAVELPAIRKGFSSLEAFVGHAQSVLQRRKSRAGRSLELQLKAIFEEEGFQPGSSFDHQPESENGKRPDFMFPSEAAYKDPKFPRAQLRMLAVKTTCKDRWRQVINEADRIPRKHLLTLQEGVSKTQYAEMDAAGIQLVVPQALIEKYPKDIRKKLITIEDFLGEIRAL